MFSMILLFYFNLRSFIHLHYLLHLRHYSFLVLLLFSLFPEQLFVFVKSFCTFSVSIAEYFLLYYHCFFFAFLSHLHTVHSILFFILPFALHKHSGINYTGALLEEMQNWFESLVKYYTRLVRYLFKLIVSVWIYKTFSRLHYVLI